MRLIEPHLNLSKCDPNPHFPRERIQVLDAGLAIRVLIRLEDAPATTIRPIGTCNTLLHR